MAEPAAGRIVRAAPAKLNLALHIVGRRADGYHLLDSLIGFTALGDTIAVEPADELSLSIDGPFGPHLGDAADDNLVMRAARRLAALAGRVPRARISLTKRLPIASGIGGGSSDAAATLMALTELWALEIEPQALAALALELGADVPVCLEARSARLEGVGEVVTPCPPLPAVPIVLINPGIALPTPSVFRAREPGLGSGLPDELGRRPMRDGRDLAEALAPARNDLTEAAISLQPVIAEILEALAQAPGSLLARMSGSGATCFALFDSAGAADDAASRVREGTGWWCEATRLTGH